MDSLTQIVLGAAVGEATLGKKIGRKASLYGAVLGTLPDLDVLWVKNAVDSFTEHRSFTHSLIVLLLVSPLFALLLKRWHPFAKTISGKTINESAIDKSPISFQYYCFSVYLIFATHALIDWFTVYGTQLLWPLTNYPFGLASVFIVDPLYTLPLLLFLLVMIIWRKYKALIVGIAVSCVYLTWSLVAQATQANYFETALQEKGINTQKSLTLPTPLNTLLWKNITMAENGYWVSFRSIFDDKDAPLQIQFFSSENDKIEQIAETESVKRLQAFTKGFYQIRELDDGIWMSDLRMGGFGNFVFNFRVGERNQSQKIIQPEEVIVQSLRGDKEQIKGALDRMKQRVTSENIELFDLFNNSRMVQK